MNEDLIRRIEELETWRRNMSASHSIPLENDQALRARLGGELSASTHTGETQAVDEGGMATYSVAAAANGFVQKNLNGTIIYIPYYT